MHIAFESGVKYLVKSFIQLDVLYFGTSHDIATLSRGSTMKYTYHKFHLN